MAAAARAIKMESLKNCMMRILFEQVLVDTWDRGVPMLVR